MTISQRGRHSAGRVLLTGGRAPAALELARQLHAAGYAVVAAESAPYHLCRASRAIERSIAVPAPTRDRAGFIAALQDAVRSWDIDTVLPTCEETFHVARDAERLAERCRVLTAPFALLAQLHHKGEFIRLAERCGLPVPYTATLERPDAWQRLRTDPRYADGLVLKPAYSRFAASVIRIAPGPLHASGVLRIERQIAAAGASPARPWVAQELLQGQEWCTYSAAWKGRLTAHAAYRSRFRAGRGASIHFAAEAQPRLAEWVERFVGAIRYTGQIAFDFIVLPDGRPRPLECNPRATSGVHLFGPRDRLAEALLTPERLLHSGERAEPAPGGRGAMVSAAMLSYGLAQALRERQLMSWLHAWRAGRDVVYRRGDRRPALEQLRLLAWTRRLARRRGLTLLEASTLDIEWNGEP
ncbi:ATP-grasp domain-containing protein [Paenibacillus sp. IB182496]|uniref:ATP-grasp domain-containing protein n=1 Tax=Paenibacillus sabuli TaxID=2772509 RepID=A0A927GTS6_9BACL|nr:ATP-grasp domain-containing protein [Paenibacillus sabuli]MBD2847606.1 ATP-grasp domain-containing protein [Paenibacillus sabuli]